MKRAMNCPQCFYTKKVMKLAKIFKAKMFLKQVYKRFDNSIRTSCDESIIHINEDKQSNFIVRLNE